MRQIRFVLYQKELISVQNSSSVIRNHCVEQIQHSDLVQTGQNSSLVTVLADQLISVSADTLIHLQYWTYSVFLQLLHRCKQLCNPLSTLFHSVPNIINVISV